MSDESKPEPCDDCQESLQDALARTVRLTVDSSQIDSQRLCPECFADWIDQYENEMKPTSDSKGTNSEIIVD